MIRPLTALAAVLLLSACDSADDASVPAPTPTPTPAAKRAAPDFAAQGSADGAIPRVFVGDWGTTSGCTAPGLRRLKIGDRRLVADGQTAAITDVTLQEPGVATITLVAPGRPQRTWELHVAQDGTRLDRVERGRPDLAYFPCPAA